MCYPVSVMVHIKDPLVLFGKSKPSSDNSGFPNSLNGRLPMVDAI